MEIIKYNFQQHGDARGMLVALEEGKEIPFPIRRVYYMYHTGKEVRRGYHAHKKLQQILICIHGECKILLDDGSEKEVVLLNKPWEGLYLNSAIWREMFDFSEDAVLMVLASELYDENDYIRNYEEFIQYVKIPAQRRKRIKDAIKKSKILYYFARKVKYGFKYIKWEIIVPKTNMLLRWWMRVRPSLELKNIGLRLKPLKFKRIKCEIMWINFRIPWIKLSLRRVKNTLITQKYQWKKYKVVSSDYLKRVKGYREFLVEREKNRKVYVAEYYKISTAKTYEFESPAIKVIVVENIEIVGGQSFLLHGKNMIYDIAVQKRNYINLEGPCIQKYKDGKALIEYNNVNIPVIENGICAFGLASGNYYHLTMEILSRLAYVDAYEEFREFPIIVDEVVKTVPSMMELVKKVNKYNHPIIYIKDKNLYKVDKLVYPFYNTWVPINVNTRLLKLNDWLIAESAVSNIRKTILCDSNILPTRKIYLSRKNMKNLRLINEDKVRKLFKEYGFEIIYPELLSFEEQVRLFQEAKCVAGAGGAALTNIIYCHENATLVCILPKEFEAHLFSTIANIVKMKVIHLDAKVLSRSQYTSMDPHILDLNYAKDFLESWEALYDHT